ncbi:MAG: endonuclease domain-containing protein [Microgenomates group bacterium]
MKLVVPEAVNSKRMCVGYLEQLTHMSRKNRNNPTAAEDKIWQEVLRKRQTGYLFLRQKPIYRFITDFYCAELKLAIEIDGSSHNNKKCTDKLRDQFLKQIGIDTIRFTNNEIIYNINDVKNKLIAVLPPRVKEGGGGD